MMQQVQLYKKIYYGIVDLSMITRAGDVTMPAFILEWDLDGDVCCTLLLNAIEDVSTDYSRQLQLCNHCPQRYVNVNNESWKLIGEVDRLRMEPMEKMVAMWCVCMPFWLGDNASCIAKDGGAITNSSSSHTRGGSHQGFGRGGILELRAEKNGIFSNGFVLHTSF